MQGGVPMKWLAAVLVPLALLALVVACEEEEEKATATPSPTVTLTPQATPSPEVTPTPEPTPTPEVTPFGEPTPTRSPEPVVEEEPPLPSIDEAKSRHTIEVKAGDSSADIIAAYGQPSSDEILPNFDPPVMRMMRYSSLGLAFMLNSDRLCCITVTKPYSGEVFGLKIGDPISRAIAIYGDEYSTFETAAIIGIDGLVLAHFWDTFLPNWFFYSQDDTIVGMKLHDPSIYGSWIPNVG
jgi:hypothetical protein